MNETNLKTEEKSSGAKDKLHEFCSETTAHGFGRLASSSSVVERLIWSACLLAALSYSIYQGYIIVSAHLSYPVDVKVEMRQVDELEFPAVVVCNMNAVKRSALTRAVQEGLITHPTWMQDSLSNVSLQLMTSYKRALLASLDDDVKQSIGHQADEFILDCTWKGDPCGPENFTLLFNYEYGNCYVFGGGDMSKNVSAPGNQNGLSLILNIETDEYLGDFSESFGAVIDVTHSQEMYFPEENGYLVAPGQVTNIGFTKRVVSRLNYPYEGRHCGSTGDHTNLTYQYSEMACRKACIANTQLKECGCAEIKLALKPYCDPINSTQASCTDMVNDQHRRSNLNCSCNEDCKLFEYLATTSSAVWPTDAYLGRLQNILGDKASDVTSDFAEARRNLARVDVYCKSMTLEIIAQQARYQLKDLISSVGGSLGLFTGISLLTLVEFLKLMFDLTRFLCKKKSVEPGMHDRNEKESEKPGF
ncbi:hypothetical protein ACROYT_G002611 [Oculina patagonica]